MTDLQEVARRAEHLFLLFDHRADDISRVFLMVDDFAPLHGVESAEHGRVRVLRQYDIYTDTMGYLIEVMR